ncbi:MAG: serine/threonine protein kinase [Planctomycetota bacterium]|nr:MAG: serine/threonine protein kinase [Planctomycetota bacterium]
MTDSQQQRLRELFDLGAGLPRVEREDFLDRHCADEPALRAELEALLSEDERGTSPIIGRGALPRPDALDERIGRYRLIELLGEGGMGTVHLAEQEEPVRRRVALKTIRLGAASPAAARHFEEERQTLALMNHPGIARIFDGGVTEAGLPYFVMEYVPGPPLTEFCERFHLTIGRRLALFCRVCDAVQHAHQKGIVHRDLKPTNVLVSERDGEPQPKIIDFGVARALSEPEYLAFGTPLYMSPEQADPAGPPADTRTDVYALGVMLYELLAERPPIDVEGKSEAELEAALAALRGGEVPPPSERAPKGAIARGLRGDLDRITLRAMAPERSRRYASASELRADIERHLRGEPVDAMPHSPGYLARKFVVRHRLGMAMLVVLFVALAGALIATRASRDRALAAVRAEQHEAEKSAAIVEFLNHALFQASPLMSGEELTVRDMLALAETDIPDLYHGRPTAEAAARHLVGNTYLQLGEDERALAQLRVAYELLRPTQDEHRRDSFLVVSDLIVATRRVEGVEAAGPWVERALELAELEIAERRPDLRESLDEALAVARGEASSGATLAGLDELLDAVPDSLRSGYDTRLLGRLLIEASGAMVLQGDARGAEAFERIEARVREILPLDDFSFLEALWILANVRLLPGREDYANAERLAGELDERAARVLPRGHWLRADAKRLLALAAIGQGRLAEAEEFLTAAEDAYATGGAGAARARSTRAAWARLAEGLDEAGVRASWARWQERAPDWPRARSWWIVSRPGIPKPVVELALEVLAEEPETGATLSHEGMACYRLGRDATALELLDSATAANEGEGLADLAFRVLCLARLGREEEARAAAVHLEARTAPPGETSVLLKEVEGALR